MEIKTHYNRWQSSQSEQRQTGSQFKPRHP
jgi:hypothetical protein